MATTFLECNKVKTICGCCGAVVTVYERVFEKGVKRMSVHDAPHAAGGRGCPGSSQIVGSKFHEGRLK